VANRAAGKGYENEDYYSNMQFKFCPIENIHIMRGSLQKVLEGEKEKFCYDLIS
jgi:myotubularin-related protein 6/7/8